MSSGLMTRSSSSAIDVALLEASQGYHEPNVKNLTAMEPTGHFSRTGVRSVRHRLGLPLGWWPLRSLTRVSSAQLWATWVFPPRSRKLAKSKGPRGVSRPGAAILDQAPTSRRADPKRGRNHNPGGAV